ncbi:transcription factor RfeG [Stagonosporopsis vannaccii]|nr:transcription factor RfeG [Stagonosporopsis vannaccii]
MSRANQWFVAGDGIAREVITADIQRYLGPDALVKPGQGIGENQGKPGYWITAYRTLTSQMIQDLKMDSQRWREERQPEGRGGSHSPYLRDTKVSRGPDAVLAYQDSRTHAARQHWGPTNPVEHPSSADPYDRQSAPRASGYATSAPYAAGDGHYTTAPAGYGGSQPAYQAAPSSAGPRTAPTNYSGYSQRDPGYQSQPYGSYQSQSSTDAYGRPTAAPTAYATPRYFGYTDETFLVYR